MNELKVKRTPEGVGQEIRNLTAAAKHMTLWYGIEIGRRLTEAKELVNHGEWLDFLKKQTEFSQPTASRFMRLFEEYGAEQGSLFGAETKYSMLNNISVSNALRLLAVPENEREAFAAEVDAEHISTRELEEAIKARDEAHKAALEYAERLEKANAEVRRADKLAEEKKALAEKLKAANEKLDKAHAGDTEEKKQLAGEIERLKKQIAMGGAEMQAFKMRFEDWQKAYNVMLTALNMLGEEQRGKCAAAVKAVVEAWRADNGN